MNLIFNSEERVIENYFESMTFLSLKLLCYLKSIGCPLKESFLYNFLVEMSQTYAKVMQIIVRKRTSKFIF